MRGEGVPQIVEADVRQSSLVQKCFQAVVGSPGVYRQFWAERVIEYPFGRRFGSFAPAGSLLCWAAGQSSAFRIESWYRLW